MVSKDIIEKTFNFIIDTKCSPSQKARNIGASVTETEKKLEDGTRVHTFQYEDGTSITIEYDKPITVNDDGYVYEAETDRFAKVSHNGKEYELSYGDSNNDKSIDEFFQYQKDYIINNYGTDGWDFFCEYANQYGTSQGWHLNMILRGQKKATDITDEEGDFYISPFLWENHARFVEMEKNLPLDNEDLITVRLVSDLHRNDSIGKKVVSDKGHTSTSTTGQIDNYDTYGDPNNAWFVFTLNEKGSGVHGAYFGNAIREADGYDFEREVNYAPNQEFERVLIDEKNRFIIQKPIT